MAATLHLQMWALGILFAFTYFTPTSKAQLASQCFGITRGRNFLVGYNDNFQDLDAMRQLFILVVAFSDQRTDVTISSKHEVGGNPLQESFTIEARQFMRTTIPVEYTMVGTEKSLKGIRVTASSDVSVYGLMAQEFTTDAFLGIPVINLGTQYVVMNANPRRMSQFSVIGTAEESTTVQVTVNAAVNFEGQTYNRGDIVTIALGDTEAIQIQSTGDLTGSLIQSDKPVAVFSGNICTDTSGSFCDTLTEQLVPVKSWGNEHIYTAARDTDSNVYRIVAYFGETNVTIPGRSTQVLNAGEFWDGRLIGSGLVSSDQPTLMMQILATIEGRVVDPSLITIPSKEQFGYLFGFTTPSFSGGDQNGFFNYINIVVEKTARETVFLDGSQIMVSDQNVHERDITGTIYSVITIKVPKGEGVYYVEQTDQQSSPVSVIVYGYESDETYGYPAGLSLSSNQRLFSVSPYYFRDIGGEIMTITVPCFTSNDVTPETAICKFETGIGDVLVAAERDGFYTIVCETPTFYTVGITEVSVSLDNGDTFSHSGLIYVASHDDLPPYLTIEQQNQDSRGGAIDLTATNDPISLSWDTDIYGNDVTHVDVMMRDTEFSNNDIPFQLNNGIKIMGNVLNTGSVTLSAADIRSAISSQGRGLTVAAFYLSLPGSRKKRNIVSNILKGSLKRVIFPYTALRILGYIFDDELCSLFDDILKNEPTDLPPCPCRSDQMSIEALTGTYKLANFINVLFHPGVDNCYRSISPTDSGSGQQCCYSNDGMLLVGPPGGGTADRYSPQHFWRHQWWDVVPWLGCCHFASKKTCDKYYKYRPSDTCEDYVFPRPAFGFGDPHIKTFDEKEYTFNGAGEFLMASSSVHDLVLQARMEELPGRNASVYTAFVIKIKDSRKVQVQRAKTGKAEVLLDDNPLSLQIKDLTFDNNLTITVNDELSEVGVSFKTDGKSLISLSVHIQPEAISFIPLIHDTKFNSKIRGLLGNMNSDPTDDCSFLPDGTDSGINCDSSLKELHEYGRKWVVTESESIFAYMPPFDYSYYNEPMFTPIFDHPDPNTVSQDIKDLCGESLPCLFDAVVTGSLIFAKETVDSMAEINKIQQIVDDFVNCGNPGVVANGVVTGAFGLNSKVEITCNTGYVLQGPATLTCQADGTWSSNLPQCVGLGRGCKVGVFGTGKVVED